MLNLDDLSRLKGHRFPRTVIGYAVWAYHRFALSLRDVEDLLAERAPLLFRKTAALAYPVAAFLCAAGKLRVSGHILPSSQERPDATQNDPLLSLSTQAA